MEVNNSEISQELNAPLSLKFVEQRRITDIFFAVIFVLACLAFLVNGLYGFIKGQPSYLGVPFDSDEKACGLSEGYEDYKFVYFPIPFYESNHKMVCVKSCPSLDPFSEAPQSIECKPNSAFPDCQVKNVIRPNPTYSDIDKARRSTFNFYSTTVVNGKLCSPNSNLGTMLTVGDNLSGIALWMYDVKLCWLIIFASASFAIVIGFLYMLLLQSWPKQIAWLSLLVFITFWALLGLYLWFKYKGALDRKSQDSDGYMLYAIICWIIGGLLLIYFYHLYNKIRIAVQIIQITACYVKDNQRVYLVPIFFILCEIALWFFWISSLIHLCTIGKLRSDVNNARLPRAYYSYDDLTAYQILYQILVGFWINSFLQAVAQYVIGSSCSIWFFREQSILSPIKLSILRAYRYHIGSLALGSLVLGFFQLLKTISAYIYGCYVHRERDSGCCWNCLMIPLHILMGIYDKFLKFLDKMAFVQIAIKGENFCVSATNAYNLVKELFDDISKVSGIGTTLIFIGKCIISSSSTVLALLIIYNVSPYKNDIISSVGLLILIFVMVSYTIGIIIMSVHGMAADAVLQCFTIDILLTLKTGSPSLLEHHWQFMSILRKILNVSKSEAKV